MHQSATLLPIDDKPIAMDFERGHLYHVYNQGNNRQKIFFNRDNYLFFLKKMRIHLLPFCDVFAYCLMPNHFHLLVRVNRVKAPKAAVVATSYSSGDLKSPDEYTPKSYRDSKSPDDSSPTNYSTDDSKSSVESITLNQSIAIMLRSYTRAINKQEGAIGSLFRSKTKAECLTCPTGITPSFYNTRYGTTGCTDNPNQQYPQVCFNYIHQNPVNSGLVKDSTEWEFSSAKDYAGLRQGTLVNKPLASQYLFIG